MLSRIIIKAIALIIVAAVNIVAMTIITLGVGALPAFAAATILTFTGGAIIGWDF